jgi:hypothetical protein
MGVPPHRALCSTSASVSKTLEPAPGKYKRRHDTCEGQDPSGHRQITSTAQRYYNAVQKSMRHVCKTPPLGL